MILTNNEWQFLNGKRNLMLIKMYDNMFQVLHLIGLALHEQRRNIHEGNHNFDFIGKALKGTVTNPILAFKKITVVLYTEF